MDSSQKVCTFKKVKVIPRGWYDWLGCQRICSTRVGDHPFKSCKTALLQDRLHKAKPGLSQFMGLGGLYSMGFM